MKVAILSFFFFGGGEGSHDQNLGESSMHLFKSTTKDMSKG